MPSPKRNRSLGRISLIPGQDDEDERFRLPARAVEKLDFRELFTFGIHDGGQTVLDRKVTSNGAIIGWEYSTLHGYEHRRFLAIPGEPPRLKLEISGGIDFEIPSPINILNPRFAYEDLCRAAEESNMLDAIKSASFVIDVETLSALFHTVHGQIAQREYDENMDGMCFNIYSEDDVTFVKTINSFQLKGPFYYTASSHLKKNAT